LADQWVILNMDPRRKTGRTLKVSAHNRRAMDHDGGKTLD